MRPFSTSGTYPQITCSTERVLFPAVPWYPLTHLGGTLCLSGGWCSVTGGLFQATGVCPRNGRKNKFEALLAAALLSCSALVGGLSGGLLLLILPYHFPGWPGGLLNSLPRRLATNRFIIWFLGCRRTQKTESPSVSPLPAVHGFICVYRELRLAHQKLLIWNDKEENKLSASLRGNYPQSSYQEGKAWTSGIEAEGDRSVRAAGNCWCKRKVSADVCARRISLHLFLLLGLSLAFFHPPSPHSSSHHPLWESFGVLSVWCGNKSKSFSSHGSCFAHQEQTLRCQILS